MKHCDHCNRDFPENEENCPLCGAALQQKQADELSSEEIVSTMTMIGLL